MTLAIGTALQYGNYVIDALGLEDSVGPVYLATYIPRGRSRLLRILGSRHPEAIPPESERLAFYDYLRALDDLALALLPSSIECFEEEGVCYQVLAQPVGNPLTQVVSTERPLSLPQSLALMLKLVDTLKAIEPLGWAGLRLEPDQIWWRSETNQVSFIGFDLPPSPLPSPDIQTATLVEGLRHLLYFLLTGHRAESTRAPLEVDLRHRRPDLQINLDRVLQRSPIPTQDSSPVTLTAWVNSLPRWKDLPPAPLPKTKGKGHGSSLPKVPTLNPAANPSPPLPVTTPALAAAASPRTQVILPRQPVVTNAVTTLPWQPRTKLTWSVLLTAMVAGGGGLTFGLQARFHHGGNLPLPTSPLPGINPSQSFPPLPDWNGKDFSSDWSNSSRQLPQRPDYGSTPLAPVNHPNLTRPNPAPAAVTTNPPVVPPLTSPEFAPDPSLANPDPTVTQSPAPPPKSWPRVPRSMAGATDASPPAAPTNPATSTPTPAPITSPPPIAPAPSSQSPSPAVNL